MKYSLKRFSLLLIAAIIVLSVAGTASSYPLETAVGVWNMDNNGDDNGLPYTIHIFSDQELQLTLLEDINLTLRRN